MPTFRVPGDGGRQIDLEAHRVTRVGDVLVVEEIGTATGKWQKVAEVPLGRVQSAATAPLRGGSPGWPPSRRERDEEQLR